MLSRIVVLLLLGASALAQNGVSFPRYQIINGDNRDKFLTQLAEASLQGYRWVMGHGCSTAVLERVASPPEIYRYIIGDLKALELRSFRPVQGINCDTYLLAEKPPIPHNFHYGEGREQGKIKDGRSIGFRYIVPSGYHLRTDGLVEADGEPGMHAPEDNVEREYILLKEPRGRVKDLNAFAAEGYRVAAAYVIHLYMVKDPSGRFEYAEAKLDKSPVVSEQRLNQEGTRGFHLTVTNQAPTILERNLEDATQYRFRVLTPKSTQDELDKVAAEGFVPAALAVHVGWNLDLMYVWQKAVLRTTAPQ